MPIMTKVNSIVSTISQTVGDHILSPLGTLQGHVVEKLQSSPELARYVWFASNGLFFAGAHHAASCLDASMTRFCPDFSKTHADLKNRSIACLTGMSSVVFSLLWARLTGIQFSKTLLTIIAVWSASLRLLLVLSRDYDKLDDDVITDLTDPNVQIQTFFNLKNKNSSSNDASRSLARVDSSSELNQTEKIVTKAPETKSTDSTNPTINQQIFDDESDYKNGVPPPGDSVPSQSPINSVNKPLVAGSIQTSDRMQCANEQHLDQLNEMLALNIGRDEAYKEIDEILDEEATLDQVREMDPDSEDAPPIHPIYQAKLDDARAKQRIRKQKNQPKRSTPQQTKSEQESKLPVLSGPLDLQIVAALRMVKKNPHLKQDLINQFSRMGIGGSSYILGIDEVHDFTERDFSKMENELKRAQPFSQFYQPNPTPGPDQESTEQEMKQRLNQLSSQVGQFMNLISPQEKGQMEQIMRQMFPEDDVDDMLQMATEMGRQQNVSAAETEYASIEDIAEKYPEINKLHNHVDQYMLNIFDNGKNITNIEQANKFLSEIVSFLHENLITLVQEVNKVREKADPKMKKSLNRMLEDGDQICKKYLHFLSNPDVFLDSLRQYRASQLD